MVPKLKGGSAALSSLSYKLKSSTAAPMRLQHRLRYRKRHPLDEHIQLLETDYSHLHLLGTLSLAYMHIVLPLLIIFAIISKTLFSLKGMIFSSIPGGDIFVLKMRKIRYQLRSQYGNNPRGRC